jgi:NAD(P)H dehydrogenase (quinone)
MLLVTGANGNLGGAIIRNLRNSSQPGDFAVATRNPQSSFARTLAAAGIDVRRADFDSMSTLSGTFTGIRKALIISTYSDNSQRMRQNLNALDAARKAGVEHIIYTSFINASQDSLSEHSRLVHYPTEQAIIASGLTYTLLRHALYADILVNDLEETLASGVLQRCGGESACAYIAREDLGLSAATVLVRDGHENRIYTETMTRTYTGKEIARALSDAFGREIKYRAIAAEDWPQYMVEKWKVPVSLAGSATGTMRAVESGEFDIVTRDYESITGRRPRSLVEFLQGLEAARSGSRA